MEKIVEPPLATSPINTTPPARTWDARVARWLVAPLKNTWVTPNHLTTLRLLFGVAGAICIAQGAFISINVGALLIVLSNFIDHTDGELARISGKSSKIGHFYDLFSDAFTTIALFVSLGLSIAAPPNPLFALCVLQGAIAGIAVALIFYGRMRIEALAGKTKTKQASAGGFETEDVLYLLPLVTLARVVEPFIIAASIGAPLFALWVMFDYRRIKRRTHPVASEVWAPQ